LIELKRWVCCGSVEVSSIDYLLSLALPSQNLTQISKINLNNGNTLVTMACPACMLNHAKAIKELEADNQLKLKISQIINEEITFNNLKIKHLLNIIINDIGIEKIKQNIKTPLSGLKTVAYYGCVLLRPSEIIEFDNPEVPKSLDMLIQALGAESLPFPYKTKCCGGALLMSNKELTCQLSSLILTSACELKAQYLVLACPMCHMTLSTILPQLRLNHKLDIIYFTQLIGLAFGISPKDLGLKK
jgi:heterodisulfide reductase subunit B